MENQLITFETAKLAKEKGFGILSFKEKLHTINCQNLFEEYWYDKNGELCYIEYPGDEGLDSYIDKKNINTTYLAATQSLLQRWLREKHKINISMISGSNAINLYYYEINKTNKFPIKGDGSKNYTYEQALEESLLKALELI